MKKIYFCIVLAIVLSCNNNSKDKNVTGNESDLGTDKDVTDYPKYVNPDVKPFSGRSDNDEEEIKARRAIIFMSIDSTYYAINAIEQIKNELSGTSSISLSVPERNLKSKAILKMNIIQNSLARQVDSALLDNLKMHTRELTDINNSISSNVVHLKNLSQQLYRVAGIMNQVTNVLSVCISKGLIKPPTPVTANPEVIKETVK